MNLQHIRKTLVLQHDQSDCGVASLLALIRYYNGDYSLERLRELSGTNKEGTTLLGLYQAAQQVGFIPNGYESNITALIKHGQPVILHLLLEEKYQHYVVCYGYENEQFIIGNPAKGLIYYTKDELEKAWKSHVCLTLSCSDKFEYKKNISKRKKQWILNIIKDDYEILIISIVLGIFIALLGATIALFSQKLVDEIIPNKDLKRLWLGLLLVFILLTARLGMLAIRQFMLFTQSRDFNNRIISFFYNRLLKLPRSFFDTRKIGELVARLNDTRRIQQVISTLAGNFIIDILVVIVTLVLMFSYSWKITLILTLNIPIFMYIIYRNNDSIIAAQQDVMSGYARSESNFINTMQGIDSIKSFNKQQFAETVNKSIYGIFQDNIFRLGKINVKLSFISGFISAVITILVIGLGSYYVLEDNIKLGELIAIISLVGFITPSIINLALISIPINEAKVAFNRMFDFANTSPEKYEGNSIQNTIYSLEVQDLSFRFPGRSPIIKSFSLSINKNAISFIIGESGCGKSTFCHLLERSYIPESGKIILNNKIDIQNLSINEWRNNIGIIPQEIFIFNGTILDNIYLGISDINITSKDIIEKCSILGFDKYISKLPQGYMTIVGEEGINLSGGQRQLIALIRLLLKNPEIMILDEPTSSMDRDLEKYTLDLLQKIKKNKIIIFVSHRFHIFKQYADKIFLIENGNVTHSGTHEDLMKTDNLYSSYWNDFK